MILKIILSLIMICSVIVTVVMVFKIITHERKRGHYKEQYLKYLKHLAEIYKNFNSLE